MIIHKPNLTTSQQTSGILTYKKLSQKKLKDKLKKGLKRKAILPKRNIKSILKFMENGGKVKLAIIDLKKIKESINKRNFPILLIERKCLYGKDKGDKGHFVIPIKMKEGKITVHDPNAVYGGVKSYQEKDVLFSLYSRRGYVLFAKPKKELH